MEKMQKSSYKDWLSFFLKQTFLLYATQRKRKAYNLTDLLTLSLAIIIIYIYSLGKKR